MPKVSIFSSVTDTKVLEDMDEIEYLERTRDGEWMDITLDCRNLKTEDEQNKYKKTIPTVTLSGTFDVRRDSSLKKHTGRLVMDLDDVPDMLNVKAKLKRDKYVFACWVSTGGKGLRVAFSIEPLKHKEAFLGIEEYLFNEYGITCVDQNGKNVSKPYCVSWDPDLFMAFNEVPIFKNYIKEIFVKKEADFVHTSTDFELVMKQITGGQIQIYDTYNDWLKIGFALAEQFGEGGRSYFHDISSFWNKYTTRGTDSQFKYCLTHKSSRPAGIATFYYLAKHHGVNIYTEQTRKIVRATKNGKKVGLSTKQIIDGLKKEGITDSDEVVKQVFAKEDYSEDEETIIHQLEMYISINYSLRMNTVTGYLEQSGKSLTESDLNTIFITIKKLIPKLDFQLMMRLLKSDFVESYNPFFEFFKSDGIAVILPATPIPNTDVESPLIDKLASCIKNEYPGYTVYFLRKWIVSCISSAHGVHSPLQMALLGPQNTGKTEFLRRLPPKELIHYYGESKLEKGKDDELLMTQYLWIMDDEMGNKTKQEAAKLKNITSTQYYYIRRPYGTHNEKILRLAVLCGTSNTMEILNDPTGNRRVIPVEVDAIDKELYNTIDKTQLWLEAMKLYKQKFDWRITEQDRPFLNKNQETYTVVNKEQELIMKYFEPGDENKLTSSEIMVEINKLTDLKLSINEVGKFMHSLGFEKKSFRDGFSTSKKWFVNRRNRPEQIQPQSIDTKPDPF